MKLPLSRVPADPLRFAARILVLALIAPLPDTIRSAHAAPGPLFAAPFGPVSVIGDTEVTGFELLPVAPSPSHGMARIAFATPQEARVRISVLDVLGRRAALLADGLYPVGRHEVTWDAARSDTPRSGVYFVRFEWPGGSTTRRLALVR